MLSSVAPLVMLVSNRSWMFTTEGYIDPWHYVGFFREYLNPNYSPGAYKLARLPWILAGFLAHHLFSPVPAAYVLHGSFLILTSLAMFAGLYALFGRVSLAGVVAIMLGFYTHAHGSGGWDYHNTAAGAFYLLTFMLLAIPGAISGRRVPLIAAGATAALAIHSNITLVNFLPALIYVHLITVRTRTGAWPSVRTVLVRFAWSLFGAVLVTVMLGLVNVWAGREFLFFATLARITTAYVADPQHNKTWWMQGGWALTATHLALPAAVFGAGALSAALNWRPSRRDGHAIARSLVLQFLAMSLVWAGWEKHGELALSWNYFAYPLVPSCFIAIGGLLSMGWPEFLERHWLLAILFTVAVAALFLAGIADPYMGTVAASVVRAIAPVGCLLFVVGLAAYVVRPGTVSTIAAIVVFAIGNRFVCDARPYLATNPCKIQEAIYAAIVESAAVFGEIDKTYIRERTWFDQPEEIHPTTNCVVNLGSMSGSITSMAFVSYLTRPWPMPSIDSIPDADIQSVVANHALLTIITAKQETLNAWSRRLKRMDLEYEEVANRRVSLLASEFSIHAWEIRQKAPPVDFDAPIITVTDQTTREANVYGTPKGTVVNEPDRVVFRPTDSRDHVAYPFVKIPAHRHNAWARITAQLPLSVTNAPSCQLVIQDPSYNVLATIRCETSTGYVLLSDQTLALRVVLFDRTRKPIVIPHRIEVALSK